MGKAMKNRMGYLLFLVFLTGCVTTSVIGRKIDEDDLKFIDKGRTTRNELYQRIGMPIKGEWDQKILLYSAFYTPGQRVKPLLIPFLHYLEIRKLGQGN